MKNYRNFMGPNREIQSGSINNISTLFRFDMRGDDEKNGNQGNEEKKR